MQCRTHAAQLGRLDPQFKAAGTQVLAILGEPIVRAQSYARSLKVPFPVLADPDLSAYSSYDLDKALIVIQRTASVLIGRDGTIRYLKRATNPATWLGESAQLLEAAVRLAQEESAHI
jgi:peroxiredoxin